MVYDSYDYAISVSYVDGHQQVPDLVNVYGLRSGKTTWANQLFLPPCSIANCLFTRGCTALEYKSKHTKIASGNLKGDHRTFIRFVAYAPNKKKTYREILVSILDDR